MIIGAPKCATTWLFGMLTSHPDIWMPPDEIHYFDGDIMRRPLSWYFSIFDDPDYESKVVGEKTPDYVRLNPRAISFLQKNMPKVKIIIMLRRPDERAWSHAKMEISKMKGDFLNATQSYKLIVHTGTLRNVSRTNYVRFLKHWTQRFPPEQLFVGFVDELSTDPDSFLKRVYRFLGVNVDIVHDERRIRYQIWESPKLEMSTPIRWYLQKKYRSMVLKLLRKYPDPVSDWLEPDPAMMEITLAQKLKIIFLASICTLPVNTAYLLYHGLKNIRMEMCLRSIEKSTVE